MSRGTRGQESRHQFRMLGPTPRLCEHGGTVASRAPRTSGFLLSPICGITAPAGLCAFPYRLLYALAGSGGWPMTFEEILDQAIAMLQRRGRLTYGTLKRQFQLDDEALDDLKNELIYGQRLVVDEDARVLVWTGDTGTVPPAAARVETPAQTPLAYTPSYLAEKILTSRRALEGERKQVTVLFADLKGNTELIRDLDPEAGQMLLDAALQQMMDAVHRFE